jgi:alpha-galactosidase
MKPLFDGSKAVVLFNRGSEAGKIRVAFEEIGLAASGRALVRDLWQRADLGTFERSFEAPVGAHDVVVVRIAPAP